MKQPRDIDSVTRLDPVLRAAVEVVAARHDFGIDWLNDRAAGFFPVGLSPAECEVAFEHPRLRILTPAAEWVVIMKLYRLSPLDQADIVALWPSCDFDSVEDAAARF